MLRIPNVLTIKKIFKFGKTPSKIIVKDNMKNLYAYFGLLGIHQVDSPGHSLYQLGLIDSICESYGECKFDFYSFYLIIIT